MMISEKPVRRQRLYSVCKLVSRLLRQGHQLENPGGELTALFKRLYEDNVLGRIPNEQFRLLSSEYTTGQLSYGKSFQRWSSGWNSSENSLTNVAQFIDKAKRCSEITELTPEILRLFIEKIVAGETSQKHSRTAEQGIWIYYRDTGLMDTPGEAKKAQEAELEAGETIHRTRPLPP